MVIGGHQLRFRGGAPRKDWTATSIDNRTVADVQFRDALLLVSDIEGFTTLSEKLRPEQLSPIIGTWYAETERILNTHGGTLDKFIGDCALAYWLDTSPGSRLAAVHAALDIQRVSERVGHAHHDVLDSLGLRFRTGSALHLGPTAYGAISPSGFTLLGDAVNLVFRLEGLTRSLGKDILASADFLDSWDAGTHRFTSCGLRSVKGRAGEVEVYALELPRD